MIELAEDNLAQIVAENDKVMVQFGASWCGNCRITKPTFKRLSGENKGITFIYVDAENLPKSRTLAQVSNLPTFAGFKGGQLIKQVQGNKGEIINQVLDAVTHN